MLADSLCQMYYSKLKNRLDKVKEKYTNYTKTKEGKKKVKEILEEGKTKVEIIAKENYELLKHNIVSTWH